MRIFQESLGEWEGGKRQGRRREDFERELLMFRNLLWIPIHLGEWKGIVRCLEEDLREREGFLGVVAEKDRINIDSPIANSTGFFICFVNYSWNQIDRS